MYIENESENKYNKYILFYHQQTIHVFLSVVILQPMFCVLIIKYFYLFFKNVLIGNRNTTIKKNNHYYVILI